MRHSVYTHHSLLQPFASHNIGHFDQRKSVVVLLVSLEDVLRLGDGAYRALYVPPSVKESLNNLRRRRSQRSGWKEGRKGDGCCEKRPAMSRSR